MANYYNNYPHYSNYYVDPQESGVAATEQRRRENDNIANDYVWHGRSLETQEEVTDWLETLSDEDLEEDFGAVRITGGFTIALFRQFGALDAQLEHSPSTQLGIFANTMRQEGRLKNLTQTLIQNAAVGLGVRNSDTYRLFYHAGIEMKADRPDATRGMHNFMSMIDNMNRPPDIEDTLAHLQAPISLEDTRYLQAVAALTGELADQDVKLKSEVALRNALAGTYNLLKFIHEQRPEGDASSNAEKIMLSLKPHHTQDAYSGLRDRTSQIPHIPYTAYIKLANSFSRIIASTEKVANGAQDLPKLDEVSIIDLPKALDRILFIACLGNVSGTIAEKPEVQAAIATSRLAIDNVISFGVERKIGNMPLSLLDIVVALRTYLPPQEAAATIQRMSEGTEDRPANRDALRRRIKVGRQMWLEDMLRRPGYGPLS